MPLVASYTHSDTPKTCIQAGPVVHGVAIMMQALVPLTSGEQALEYPATMCTGFACANHIERVSRPGDLRGTSLCICLLHFIRPGCECAVRSFRSVRHATDLWLGTHASISESAGEQIITPCHKRRICELSSDDRQSKQSYKSSGPPDGSGPLAGLARKRQTARQPVQGWHRWAQTRSMQQGNYGKQARETRHPSGSTGQEPKGPG